MADQERKIRWGLGSVGAVVVLILVLAPMVVLFTSMFQGEAAKRWSTVNDVILDRVSVTVILAVTVAVLAVSLALPFALALRRARFPGRQLLRALYVMPLLIPPHIQAISWMRVLGRKGFFTEWLANQYDIAFDVRAGFIEVGGKPIFFPGATWMLVAAFWPLAALIISAGLARLDPRAEETALFTPRRDPQFGERLKRIFSSIVRGRWFLFLFPHSQRKAVDGAAVPLLRPHILAGGFFVFIFAAGCYPIPALLDTPTIMIDVFFIASQVDSSAAGVISAPLVLMTVVALLWTTSRSRSEVFQSRAKQVDNPASLQPRNYVLGIFAWLLVLITSGVPLYALLEKAGGIDTYKTIWKLVESDIHNSLSLALVGALIVALGGSLVAFFVAKLGAKRGFLVEALALLPFAFPAVVVGVAMNKFWGGFRDHEWVPQFLGNLIDSQVYQQSGIFYFCFLALFLPFAMRCVTAAIRFVDPRQVDAGLLANRQPKARFKAIVWPVIFPGVAAAFMLGFVLSLGELGASMIVQPPDASTVQIRIFNMIHFARDEEVAALCVMIVAVTLLPTLIYALLFNRKVEVL